MGMKASNKCGAVGRHGNEPNHAGKPGNDSGPVHACDHCNDHDHSLGRGHRHDHAHGDHGDPGSERLHAAETGGALVMFAAGMAVRAWFGAVPGAGKAWLVLLLAAYVLAGWRVLASAGLNIVRGRLFDENFLMAVASVGAIAVGEIPEAVGVMVFFSIGEILQDIAVERSRGAISSLMDIRPDSARVIRDGQVVQAAPESLSPGDRIVVRPGERAPLDGRVVEGESSVDTSALTGESMPRPVGLGDEVLAGMVNTSGVITLSVERPYAESAVARVLSLVEQAAGRKAQTERFITTFSRYYTPAVVGVAATVALVPPLLVPGQLFSMWLHRALVLLVISCPCALVISIPLSYFAGIGGASRRGVLVKGANFLEALNQVDTVIFDKTGTLTRGSFRVVEVTGENGYNEEQVLRIAAHAGAHSTHPVSVSIREKYENLAEVDRSLVSESDEVGGCGVRAIYRGERVLAGNDRLLHRENVQHDTCITDGTVVNVAADGILAGRIRLADEVKPAAPNAIRRLHDAGVSRVIMLTGDVAQVAEEVAGQVGIDEYSANLLPAEKVAALEAIMAERESGRRGGKGFGRGKGFGKGKGRGFGKGCGRGKVVFVGDGINDAPALTRADVGVAMGGLGSDAAIEAADVVIMDDNPARIVDAIDVAHATRRVVIENITLALSVKALVLALGAAGIATMWSAVFADVGVTLIAVANATRAYGPPASSRRAVS
ncbi:MAG: heavy metal translocating P-type ATPase [Clostridia bacterium]|nr:heavy metal translocating P-type ATPase [Clostridia bacterium]